MPHRLLRSVGHPVDNPAHAPSVPGVLSERLLTRKAWLLSLAALFLGLSVRSQALTIVTGPSFAQATNAPLSGVLQLTTDIPSRIGVSVDDGIGVWERQFYDFGTAHSVPLFGFKPGRTNQIAVTAYDQGRNAVTAQPLMFITDPLPSDFPNVTLLQADSARMEPGYTLFRVEVHGNTYAYVAMVDNSGAVVWYANTPSTADVRQLNNGDLFMPSTNRFVEMNLLGDIVQTWFVPSNLLIDPHDGVPTSHGTILYLNNALESVSAFPTSATDPTAPLSTAEVLYQKVVEISATNATVLNTWSPIDVLDPRRISSLFGLTTDGLVPVPGWDTEHSNAVIEDPSDDSLIVSMRDQNAVIKFSRATGQLHWILGPPEGWGPQWQPYLLTPVGSPFAWQYGQRAPILTAQGTLILYDDGNFRASPFNPPVADSNNFSRAVEYKINEQTMEVSQVWDYGRTNVAQRLYTGFEGNADPLPKTGNVLIGFPAVSYVNGVPPSSYGASAVMARITEVTHDAVPQIVFDLAITMYDKTNLPYLDCTIYRCHRIPDLYAHAALPIANLSVTIQGGVPLLEFSADDTRAYLIEASANLIDWERIGTPVEDPESPGDFQFPDGAASAFPARYYRVVTQ
jgi:arylsulfate sulfotransferase